MKRNFLLLISVLISTVGISQIIIDHNCTKLDSIPLSAINSAKQKLHIAYGHTSHGSQLTTGMNSLIGQTNLTGYKGDIYNWNNGGNDDALDLHDYAMSGDVGYYPQWVNNTRSYLDNSTNSDVNVVMWSWCGQASRYSEQDMIDKYLAPMTQLETDYPNVTFVYMTGHANGSGETGNLHLRNQQIKNYCNANNKVLYDFYDIECYDPDGNYYGDKIVNDNCDYDSNNDGTRDANWATEWQNSHTEGVDWYNCSSAHSKPLNANQKAYATWWLFCRIAGWTGSSVTSVSSISETSMEIFPNPAQDELFFTLNSNHLSDCYYKIYDIKGQHLLSGTCSKSQNVINIENLANGIYIIKAINKDKIYSQKFTVTK